MRERKYRAWLKQEQKMYEVNAIYFVVQYGMAPSDRANAVELYSKSKAYREGEDIELMEYAGRKDEKGNDVFEGDVLGVDDPEDDSVAVVVFHDGAFKAQIKEGVFDQYWGGWIVIGNQYEHPHLLEKAK